MNLPFLISVEPVSCFQRQDPVFLFIFTTVGMEKLKSLLWWQETSCGAHRASPRPDRRGAPSAHFLYGKSFTPLKQTAFGTGSHYKNSLYSVVVFCLLVGKDVSASFLQPTFMVWRKTVFLSLRVRNFLARSGWFQMVCGNSSCRTSNSRLGWKRQAVPLFQGGENIFGFPSSEAEKWGRKPGGESGRNEADEEALSVPSGTCLAHVTASTPHTVQWGRSLTLPAVTSFTFFSSVKAHFTWQVLKC